jgi:hypothetical protein
MSDLQTTIIVIVFISFATMLIAGATNKIVIYYDVKDFFVSFAPWVSVISGILLINLYHHGEEQISFSNMTKIQLLFWYAGLVFALLFTIWSIKLSITHNKSIVLGFFVGWFKIILTLLGVVILIGQIKKIFDKDSNMKDTFLSLLIFGIFVWMGKRLINGKEVYIAKGWALPKKKLSYQSQ